ARREVRLFRYLLVGNTRRELCRELLERREHELARNADVERGLGQGRRQLGLQRREPRRDLVATILEQGRKSSSHGGWYTLWRAETRDYRASGALVRVARIVRGIRIVRIGRNRRRIIRSRQ